ncbi:MAG: hypothetical protein VYA55_16035 [Pseudomonadota bacterium]|nr:hypothetical protein [Pseudomonadota bacterium]
MWIERNSGAVQGFLGPLLMCLGVLVASSVQAADELAYKLDYTLELLPESEQAAVTIAIDKGKLFRYLEFDNLPGRYSAIQANGKLSVTETRVRWEPPAADARLSMRVKITHERDPGEFDAMINWDWAIFRGDDLFPAIKSEFDDGAYAEAQLTVILPQDWKSIETGWPRRRDNVFRIDNPERKFDRPTGWMIAGKLGTRRDTVGTTSIAISAPKGGYLHRMDLLTFFNFVWPELERAFHNTPEKLLVVGMGDPMWRGGLSASNSFYLHSDRPMVSENGTSPLLHELTHMVTRIRGSKSGQFNDDWIAEGLAEFYSFELLYRAGGMTQERRDSIVRKLGAWGKGVKSLRKSNSSGKITARAVVLMDKLDKEIRSASNDQYNLDHLARELMAKRTVSLDDLERAAEALIGAKSKVLQSPLLR